MVVIVNPRELSLTKERDFVKEERCDYLSGVKSKEVIPEVGLTPSILVALPNTGNIEIKWCF